MAEWCGGLASKSNKVKATNSDERHLLEQAKKKEFNEIRKFLSTQDARQRAIAALSSKQVVTLLCYCASSATEEAETATAIVIETFGEKYLYFYNDVGVSPLHRMVQFHRWDSWKRYISWGSVFYDRSKNTWFHYAAKNATLPGFWEIITKEMGIHELMLQENAQKQIPLHFVAQYQSKELVSKAFSLVIGEKKPTEFKDAMENNLLHYAGSGKSETLQHLLTVDPALFQVILTRNSQGQTPLHFAAQSKSRTPDLFNKVVEDQQISALDVMNKVDNNDRSIAFYACMGNNFDLLRNCNVELQSLLKVDNDDNTLLHALFKYYSYKNDFDKDDWTSMFLDLVDAGCDPKAENSRHHNCLLASEMHHEDLRDIMSSMDSDLTDKLQELVTNSKGEHAVHIFSGRYAVQHIIEDLSTLCDKSEEDLLQLRAEKGRLKGGTCLHFACELGQLDSVAWLMSKGLQLSDRTSSGESCIDVACDRGKHMQILDKLMEREKYDELDSALQLIDCVHKSLPAPRKSSAKKHLDTFTDHQVQFVKDQSAAGAYSPDKLQHILLLAIKIDSTDLLRKILSEHSNNDQHDRISQLLKDLPQYCFKEAINNKDEFLEDFREDCLNDNSATTINNLQATEVAVIFGAFDVAVDLLLLSQFDLIPKCLRILKLLKKIRKSRNEKENGETTCMGKRKELYESITTIIMRALDSLYLNASNKKRQLVFWYLKGHGKIGHSKTSHDEEDSVIQTIQKLKSRRIFANDCISGFVKKKWGSIGEYKSISQKFWLHAASMIVFMLLLAWLVTDFTRSVSHLVPWMGLLLYSLSLTVQEICEFRLLNKNVRYQKSGNTAGRTYKILLKSFRNYFGEMSNTIDFLAILFLWIGSVLFTALHFITSPSLPSQHTCQMMLAISFLLWGFRFVSLLSYWKSSGIIIAMLRKLLLFDLGPFLVILLVVVISFGVIQFSLLFPVVYMPANQTATSAYTGSVFLQIWSLPMRLMFGLLEFEDLKSADDTLKQSPGSVAHPEGKLSFQTFVMFAFLIIVNIVMVNVLIALFSLRVSRMQAETIGIWNRRNYSLLREYENSSWIPHPFLGVVAIISCAVRCFCKNENDERCTNESDDKKFDKRYYYKFLIHQARQFRRSNHRQSFIPTNYKRRVVKSK